MKKCGLRNVHNQTCVGLSEARGLLEGIDYRSDWELPIRGEINTIADASAKPWLESVENEVARLRDCHNRKKTGKEVNDDLNNTAIKLAADGESKYFAKFLILPEYVKLANKYCISAEQQAVTRCNKFLDLIEEVAKSWRQQISDRKTTYCHKRRVYFMAYLQRVQDGFDAEVKPKEEATKASENLIRQMFESIGNLELPLDNAVTSMK